VLRNCCIYVGDVCYSRDALPSLEWAAYQQKAEMPLKALHTSRSREALEDNCCVQGHAASAGKRPCYIYLKAVEGLATISALGQCCQKLRLQGMKPSD
jgi:hypothetical protein